MRSAQVLAFALIAITLVSASELEAQPSKWDQLWAKIKGDFWLLVIGLIATLFAIPFLYFNERRTINKDRVVHIADDLCKEAKASELDAGLNNQLVHISSEVTTSEPVTDKAFGLSVLRAAKLVRTVEVFQTVEEKVEDKREGLLGNITNNIPLAPKNFKYTYERKFTDRIHDSYAFLDKSHQADNATVTFPVRDATFYGNVKIGVHTVADSQLAKLTNLIALPCPEGFESKLSSDIQKFIKANNLFVTTQGNVAFLQKEKGTNSIGDVRVTFQYADASTATIVASQNGDSFAPFDIKAKITELEQGCMHSTAECVHTCCNWTFCCYSCCDCVNKQQQAEDTIEWVADKTLTKDEVFASQRQVSPWTKWGFRILGIVVLAVGLWLLVDPLLTIIFKVHILGKAVTFWEVAGASLLAAVLIALVIGGLAWFYWAPWLSIGLLAVGVGILVWVIVAGGPAAAGKGGKAFLA